MPSLTSVDPRTGRTVEVIGQSDDAAAVAETCERARAATPFLWRQSRADRVATLKAIADSLEAERHALVPLADRETALGLPRLNSELTRTCFQFRFFADVVEEGAYLQATIDSAQQTPMGPRPDLRRMLVPLGPVAVFGASNFPFAFSVPGGDTASALAAGCAVVVKAHPSHPALSNACYEIMAAALQQLGAPQGTLGIVHGQDAGAALVMHPAIRAVGFTGSQRGGRALFDLATSRPDPIPFYGELGSTNPLIVTPNAARDRAAEIGHGIVASVTMGAGQFCTKPGIVFVPEGEAGEAVRAAMIEALRDVADAPLLNSGIHAAFKADVAQMERLDDAGIMLGRPQPSADGYLAAARLVSVAAGRLTAQSFREVFGPFALLVTYSSEADLLAALSLFEGSLTISLHVGGAEEQLQAAILDVVAPKVGRIVWNGYPTGVAVSWAMQHGGPWPASTSARDTSVGAAAIQRFLRPVVWQSAPEHCLPPELRRTQPNPIPVRLDGAMTLPAGERKNAPRLR
jgi:NADP-dependent aldehyde dehydrogenase